MYKYPINITINLHPGERYLHKRVDILVITFHTETAHVWQTVGPINRKNVESSLPVGYKFATDRQKKKKKKRKKRCLCIPSSREGRLYVCK